MASPSFDVFPFLQQDEGQHLERKSLFEGPAHAKRPRGRPEVRDQIAEQVAAFANAEGGVLILGIEDGGGVTLRNTPLLSEADKEFVSAVDPLELTDVEFRTLLEAFRHGRVDNSLLRNISGLDTLTASSLLRRLRDRGLLELHAAGSASHYELGGLEPDRGGLEAEVQRILSTPGARPRKAKLREAVLQLAILRPWRPVELADVLDFDPGKLVERHLKEMVAEGLLERTHPENLAHPAQSYRATRKGKKSPHASAHA